MIDTTKGPGTVAEAPHRLPYTSPNLREFGSVASLTLGSGGTSVDGGNNLQKGGGNDGN